MLSNRKIFTQVLFTSLVLLLLAVATVGILCGVTIHNYMYSDTMSRQLEANKSLARILDRSLLAESRSIQKFCDSYSGGGENRMSLIASDGVVLADSHEDREIMGDHSNRPEIIQAMATGSGSSVRYSVTLDKELLYTAVYRSDLEVVVRLAVPVGSLKEKISNLYNNIILISFIVFLISVYFSFNLGRRLGRAIDSIKDVTSYYSRGDFSVNLSVFGFQEAARLNQSINSMGRQLKEKIQMITFEKNKLQAILENLVEPVILMDYRLNIIEMNQSAEKTFEMSFHDSIGKSIYQVIRNVEICDVAERTLKNECFQEETVSFRNSKREFYFHAYCCFLRGKGEFPPEILLVINDVTQLKQLEMMRRDFVANVSHELRTPVTSILGYVETLRGGAINDPVYASGFLDIISRQSYRLESIISDLLTLSSLEEKRAILKKEKINAFQLLRQVKDDLRMKADKINTTIMINCPEDLEVLVSRNLWEQALFNLADNAVKYSMENACVNLNAREEDNRIVFEVCDNGPGIPEQDLPRIFERFYRVDKARSRDMGGTGLGLAIVKHIVFKHNGEAKAKNRPEGGLCISLYIPRKN